VLASMVTNGRCQPLQFLDRLVGWLVGRTGMGRRECRKAGSFLLRTAGGCQAAAAGPTTTSNNNNITNHHTTQGMMAALWSPVRSTLDEENASTGMTERPTNLFKGAWCERACVRSGRHDDGGARFVEGSWYRQNITHGSRDEESERGK
jgi:hypothetical protein